MTFSGYKNNEKENLAKFLENDDSSMIMLGLSMATNGAPIDVLPVILGHYMWNGDKKIRSKARTVFFNNAPKDLKDEVAKEWKTNFRTLKIPGLISDSALNLASFMSYLDRKGFRKPVEIYKEKIFSAIHLVSNQQESDQILRLSRAVNMKIDFLEYPKDNPDWIKYKWPYVYGTMLYLMMRNDTKPNNHLLKLIGQRVISRSKEIVEPSTSFFEKFGPPEAKMIISESFSNDVYGHKKISSELLRAEAAKRGIDSKGTMSDIMERIMEKYIG
jgi:hypothetical protein